MRINDRLPDPPPPYRRHPRLAVIVAIAVAILAVAGVGTSVAMHNTSVSRQALGSTPTPSPGGAAQPGSLASGTATAAPTTIPSIGSVPAVSPPSTSASPPASGRVVITEFSRNPVTIVRGTEVEVDLSSANPHWNEPRATDLAVLRALGGSTSPDGSARFLFRAMGDGSTTVFAAQAPPSCSPKCLMAQTAWEITVTVTG